MTKTLKQLLTEISNSGYKEKIYITYKNKQYRFENFVKEHHDKLNTFNLISYNHNDLLMCWEIKVTDEANK